MSTNCKIVVGYTDHMGHWQVEEEFVRWSDGYLTSILPILREYKAGFIRYNESTDCKYDEWKFHEIGYDECITGEYQYYLDVNNHGKIRCTVICMDWDFYSKYGVDSYKVIWEGILNDEKTEKQIEVIKC